MRIAFAITRSDAIGGASVHVRDLARALLDRGHEVTVLVGGRGVFTEELAARGIPFRPLEHLVRPVRPWRDARAVAELAGAVERLRPDLVSSHSSKAGVVARLAGRITGVPTLFTAHGWAFTEGVPAPRRQAAFALERLLAPLAARIVTVSDHDRDLALRRGLASPERIVTVHNGMRDVDAAFRAEPAREPPTIVSVARLAPQKDFRTLLAALARIRDRDLRFEWVGGGPDRPRAEALAERLGLTGRVRFPGERLDVAERLAGAQIFVLASVWEGFPRSVLEAMRAGLPVVASAVGGVAESVRDGVTGFLVPRGDVAGLAEALDALVRDPAARRRMGAAGRAAYEREFTFDRMLAETLAVYEAALRGPRPGAGSRAAAGSGAAPPPPREG